MKEIDWSNLSFGYMRTDYNVRCIIGTKTNSYQQGIHLLIRNRKPYFGFYNNDLQGKTVLEAGKWYHLVWRYNKLSGEQAIYLNGNHRCSISTAIGK